MSSRNCNTRSGSSSAISTDGFDKQDLGGNIMTPGTQPASERRVSALAFNDSSAWYFRPDANQSGFAGKSSQPTDESLVGFSLTTVSRRAFWAFPCLTVRSVVPEKRRAGNRSSQSLANL